MKDMKDFAKYGWIFGIIFVVLGWMLWNGSLPLENAIAVLLFVFGIKYLIMAYQGSK